MSNNNIDIINKAEDFVGRSLDVFGKYADAAQTQEASPEEIFLAKTLRAIHGRLDAAAFGNAELARKMALSESQLNRKVKALTGKTLSLFIRNVRLQQAKTLLQTTGMNVSEVAYVVGFTDPNYFSLAFSEAFGVAPSSYRN